MLYAILLDSVAVVCAGLVAQVPESSWLKMEACCTSGSNNWLVEGGGAKQERDVSA